VDLGIVLIILGLIVGVLLHATVGVLMVVIGLILLLLPHLRR
jgi:hypothetical protein